MMIELYCTSLSYNNDLISNMAENCHDRHEDRITQNHSSGLFLWLKQTVHMPDESRVDKGTQHTRIVEIYHVVRKGTFKVINTKKTIWNSQNNVR